MNAERATTYSSMAGDTSMVFTCSIISSSWVIVITGLRSSKVGKSRWVRSTITSASDSG